MNNYQEIMKDTEVFYLNAEHEKIVEKNLLRVKRLMYFATENTERGKYQDFIAILESIYLYSNNFYTTKVFKKDSDSAAVEEFLFLIPNMLFYTAIGFLTALKGADNNNEIRDSLQKIGFNFEEITSELADVFIDETEKDKILKDIFNAQVTKN